MAERLSISTLFAWQKIESNDLYKEKGYPKTQVTILEGTEIDHQNVVFLIHEDELQRVSSVSF